MSNSWRGNQNTYKHGDHNVICDRSGFKVKASDAMLEWTGALVRSCDWEPRHPQDLVRGHADNQRVPYTRSESNDVFLNPGDVSAATLLYSPASNLMDFTDGRNSGLAALITGIA